MKRGDKELFATIARMDRQQSVHERKRQQRHERRVANGTAAKPRPRCTCAAYPFPHRPAGGLCRHPDPPAERWTGKAGSHPGTFGRVSGGSSGIRRRILHRYDLHPVRDRERIRRWLPKLYVATCRRKGQCSVFVTMGGYVPAMLVTEDGAPEGFTPYAEAGWLEIILQGTERKLAHTMSPARRRRDKASVPSAKQWKGKN